jgi:hypothetical protein
MAVASRGAWRGPQYPGDFPTLGWQVLEHASTFLPSPANDADPLVFTDEQARKILRWYELDPITGAFPWQRAREEEAKGAGKSPWAGAIAIEEFVGPVCFDGWDANGEPVGVPWGTGDRPSPWIQIAAVSEDQTDNTYGAMYAMLAARHGSIAEGLGIDLGRTRLYLPDRPGAVLEPVTASSGSREGQRITFAILDETHLWIPEKGGPQLARTLRRNLTKMDGRSIETTNAPTLGERSVAEGPIDPEAKGGVLHWATRPDEEPQPDWPDEKLMAALRKVYGDARWVNLTRTLADIRDPEALWEDSLRFFFNVRSGAASRAVDPRRWDDMAKPRDVPPGTPIGMGFDGSVSDDATVLRGCTGDGYRFTIGAWTRPIGRELAAWRAEHPGEDWRVPRDEVHAAVARAFATWLVGRFHPDPPKWDSEIVTWRRLYGEDVVVPFDTNQRSKFAREVDRWRTANAEGTHTHDADPVVTDHVKAARLLKVHTNDPEDDGRTLYVLVKGEDRRKIDGAIADVLAVTAAATMPPADLAEPWVIVR